MQIVPFPHPALTFKSAEVQRIDPPLRQAIARMFELMYAANGIGLAANQVGLPLRFFIVNLSARPDEPDEELVFINPLISKRRGNEVGEEGCLSLPGVYGDVARAEELTIQAYDLEGRGFEMDLDDLYARVVQHETDHLDGVMFPDRIRERGEDPALTIKVHAFSSAWERGQRAGKIPATAQLQEELKAIAGAGAVPASFLERTRLDFEMPKFEA